MAVEWSRSGWETSVSSRAWGATPYDAGWDDSGAAGADIATSTALKAIWQEEMTLDGVPAWAVEIIQRMITLLPTCGHYAFPRPILQVCEAINEESAPEFVCGCYTADSGRKALLSYYVYCLDAWLQGAPLPLAQAELALRPSMGRDWTRIVADVYGTLGESSPVKMLLVERLNHRLRWWIKTLLWPDDHRDRFLPDVYLGDVRGDEVRWGAYGNSPYGDPYFAEREVPRVRELAQRIRAEVPDGARLIELIEGTWLCAPKAFRSLEKLILRIGSLDTGQQPGDLAILRCEDTYPDVVSQQRWHEGFMRALRAWLDGDAAAARILGTITPAKHWLAHILYHKLEVYAWCNNLGNLVGCRPSGKRGTQAIARWVNV